MSMRIASAILKYIKGLSPVDNVVIAQTDSNRFREMDQTVIYNYMFSDDAYVVNITNGGIQVLSFW